MSDCAIANASPGKSIGSGGPVGGAMHSAAAPPTAASAFAKPSCPVAQAACRVAHSACSAVEQISAALQMRGLTGCGGPTSSSSPFCSVTSEIVRAFGGASCGNAGGAHHHHANGAAALGAPSAARCHPPPPPTFKRTSESDPLSACHRAGGGGGGSFASITTSFLLGQNLGSCGGAPAPCSLLLSGHQSCPAHGIKAVCGKRSKMEDMFQVLANFFDLPVSPVADEAQNKLPARFALQHPDLLEASAALSAHHGAPESCAAAAAAASAVAAAAAGAAHHLLGATSPPLSHLSLLSTSPLGSGRGPLSDPDGGSGVGGGSSSEASANDTLHFFGVYDGHGGTEAAEHCAKRLHFHLGQALAATCGAQAPDVVPFFDSEGSGGGGTPADSRSVQAEWNLPLPAAAVAAPNQHASARSHAGVDVPPAPHHEACRRQAFSSPPLCVLNALAPDSSPALHHHMHASSGGGGPTGRLGLSAPEPMVLGGGGASDGASDFDMLNPAGLCCAVGDDSEAGLDGMDSASRGGASSVTSSGGTAGGCPASVSSLLESALRDAFVRTDAEFAAESSSANMVGSTAVVALVGARKLWVANCGDSRAVLCRAAKAVQLTDDHKPEREDEAERVERAGGQVLYWNGHRVMGVLAMSRAIGDHALRPYVICEPEITVMARTDDDDFLLMASDGLWDVMSNQEATNLALRCLNRAREKGANKRAAVRIAASVLTKAAMDRGSKDNITVVIVDLSGPGGAPTGGAGGAADGAAAAAVAADVPMEDVGGPVDGPPRAPLQHGGGAPGLEGVASRGALCGAFSHQ